VYSIARQIAQGLLSRQQNVTDWSAQYQAAISRLCKLQQSISTQSPDLAPISVALRELRHLA
jgi:glutamate dehydrogenase